MIMISVDCILAACLQPCQGVSSIVREARAAFSRGISVPQASSPDYRTISCTLDCLLKSCRIVLRISIASWHSPQVWVHVLEIVPPSMRVHLEVGTLVAIAQSTVQSVGCHMIHRDLVHTIASNLQTVSLGCAPTPNQYFARLTSILMSFCLRSPGSAPTGSLGIGS